MTEQVEELKSYRSMVESINRLRACEEMVLFCWEIMDNSENLEEAKTKALYVIDCARERIYAESRERLKRDLMILRKIP